MLGHECRHAWLVPDSMRFPGERGVERTPAMRMPQRRFPPPWSVEEADACFIVGGRFVVKRAASPSRRR